MEANIFGSFEINRNVNIMVFRFGLENDQVEQIHDPMSVYQGHFYILGFHWELGSSSQSVLFKKVPLPFQRIHLISQRCPRGKYQEKLKDKTYQISSNITDFNIISWGFFVDEQALISYILRVLPLFE